MVTISVLLFRATHGKRTPFLLLVANDDASRSKSADELGEVVPIPTPCAEIDEDIKIPDITKSI